MMRSFVLLLVVLWTIPASAFTVPTRRVLRHASSTGRRQRQQFHCESNKNPNDMGSDDEQDEIEAVRRRLEFLVNDDDDDDASDVSDASATNDIPPLLSSIGRERRLVEIDLLQALEFSDEPTGDLWTLWYSERGPQAHAELREIEETLFADPSQWNAAESRLQDMIAHHGVHFCEPLNRLATLYYMQGRYKESKKLCQLVLEQKPWHFGALSGIVMVCASLKDIENARKWAARRLPPMVPNGTTDNQRRKEWTKRAVDDARKALMEEEERVRLAFGKRQRYEKRQLRQQSEEDAWQ
jgi:hypothetical protein